MTTSTEIIQSTKTQVVTFDRNETGPFVDLVYGLDYIFADDSLGGRFAVQIDPVELHVQVNAPDEGATAIGEIMMIGSMAKEIDEAARTDDELFQEIIDRFGEDKQPRQLISFLGEKALQPSKERVLYPDQIDDLEDSRRIRTAVMFEKHGDSEYRSWKK